MGYGWKRGVGGEGAEAALGGIRSDVYGCSFASGLRLNLFSALKCISAFSAFKLVSKYFYHSFLITVSDLRQYPLAPDRGDIQSTPFPIVGPSPTRVYHQSFYTYGAQRGSQGTLYPCP